MKPWPSPDAAGPGTPPRQAGSGRPQRTRNVADGDDALLRRRHNYMPCPHCHATTRVRTSEQVSPTTKDLYFQCLNIDCGFTWKAQLAIVWGLSPSAIPNPDIEIPMAPASVTRKTYFPPPPDFDPDQIDMFDDPET